MAIKDKFYQKCLSVSKEGIRDALMGIDSSIIELRYMSEGSQEEQEAYESLKRAYRIVDRGPQEVEKL